MSYHTFLLGSMGSSRIDFTDSMVRDLRYHPAASQDETIEETIRIALQGLPASIDAWLENASQVCEQTRREHGDMVRPVSYLICQTAAGVESWRSPLVSAWVEVLLAQSARMAEMIDPPLERLRGVTWVQVKVIRRNYWEIADLILLLSAQILGNGCTDGLPPNHLGISGELVTGGKPAPLEIEITNTSSVPVGDVWLGIDSRLQSSQAYHLECEQMHSLGAGVTITSRADFSQVSGLSFTGSAGVEVRIGVYQLDSLDLASAYNRPYRALLLAADASQGLEAWVQLVHNGVVLVRGPVTALEEGINDLGMLTLPPWPFDLTGYHTPESVDIELWVYQEDGTPSADFDAIKMLPVDGGSLLMKDLGGGLPAGESIVYQDGRLVTYQGDRAIEAEYYASHHPRGVGLWLHPGEDARLHVVWMRSAGGFDARDSLSVTLMYRRRKSWI